MSIVYLGLGSNMGDREENLENALGMLAQRMEFAKSSSVYETEPVGYLDQPRFLNMVICGKTKLEPEALLSFAKEIETKLGRVLSFSSAPRPMDIDILLYDERVMKAAELTIPHPRMAERGFVLVPLAEIASEVVHPVTGETVREMHLKIKDLNEVRKWGDVSSISSAPF